jgi:hypothetical protein
MRDVGLFALRLCGLGLALHGWPKLVVLSSEGAEAGFVAGVGRGLGRSRAGGGVLRGVLGDRVDGRRAVRDRAVSAPVGAPSKLAQLVHWHPTSDE